VNVDDQAIFTDTLSSSRVTPTAHALAGVEYTLTPVVALTSEARYVWARGRMSDDFQGFHRIDLSGLSATAGIAIRF
jgi:hypothetical protein